LDLQTFCIVVILGGIVFMLVRTMLAAGRKRAKPRQVQKIKRPSGGAFALDDALDKLNETIRILDETLADRAPTRGDAEGARFYVAYLVGVAREIARMNRIAYGPALETPIRMELIRFGISGGSTGDALARILATDEGQQGLTAGEMDGVEACNPDFRGTYFARIQTYFTDAQVRGPR